MPHPLDDPKAKLDRAYEHGQALHDEAVRFLAQKPYRVIREIDPNDGSHVFRLKVDTPAPARLSVLVGDVAHNLRSGLDHLTWQLSLITTATPYDRTEFPIYINPGPGNGCFDPDGFQKIRDVPSEAQKIIESIQPYHRAVPKDSELWILHQINRTDKHRILLATAANRMHFRVPIIPGRGQEPGFHPILYDIVTSPTMTTSAFDDGDELFRVRPHADLDEETEPDMAFEVAIRIPRAPALNAVRALSHIDKVICRDLLPQFERFFDYLGPGF
jgi:hypothetical protein